MINYEVILIIIKLHKNKNIKKKKMKKIRNQKLNKNTSK